MNQILSTENIGKPKSKKNKMKSGEPLDINIILKFFAISMIVFGVCLTGSASFGLYKNITQQEQAQNQTKPIIEVGQYDEENLSITVTHDKPIDHLSYHWNEEQETTIQGENQNYLEQVVPIPSGTNTLRIEATDINGQSMYFEEKYTSANAPEIEIVSQGNQIKATITGKNNIAYYTYRWDDEEEKRVDVNELQTEALIDIPEGLHTLTIIAVDIENNTQTKEQDVNGVNKPKLEVTTDGENFIIDASADDGIEKVEFILNGQGYRLPVGQNEIHYSYPLQDGENKLEVTVYSNSGVTETFKAMTTKN